MSETQRCPQCGAELGADAPAGLCPRCLLLHGVQTAPTQVGAGPPDQPSQPSQPSEPGQAAGESSASRPSGTDAYRGTSTPQELAARFPQLEIVELLGQGGMGAVYKARQPALDRLVAVKILPQEAMRDAAFAERFTREARALARLNHPHIVAVYDFGQRDGLFYIVMEYVDGANLRQLMRQGRCTPEEALAIVPQICEALQFAHDEGIVHRDIKPENILLDKRGRLKIADFGLAKLVGQVFQPGVGDAPAAPERLTYSGQVMGTPSYMAPEQFDDPLAVDHRADIYALGVVFYEMLTGELPRGRFAPPSQKVQVDVRLDDVVLRALEQEPQRRYQQASEVKTDVENISRTEQPPALGAPAPQTRPPRLWAEAEGVVSEAGNVKLQGPADGLILAGCAALLTSLGVGHWLWLKWNTSLSDLAKGNLVGMSVANAVYALAIIMAGVLMRRLWARLFTLVCVVISGLFVPAVGALNIVMEFNHIPQWPVLIPMWLGVPIATWATIVLFRRDVRAAFQANARLRDAARSVAGPESGSPLSSRQLQLSEEPRFSRFAIFGAVWALFGLLTVIPVLFFIGLNRVRNGTALPTDVIHEEPPLAFSLFMGALLAIGAGAPIGTTIFGSLAIQHIKGSGGRICGLPLAVADAIGFPLLLLGGAIDAVVAMAVFAVVSMIPENTINVTPGHLAMLGTPVGLIVCFFAGRAAWRSIAARVPAVEPARPQPQAVAAPRSIVPAAHASPPPLMRKVSLAVLLCAAAAWLTTIGEVLVLELNKPYSIGGGGKGLPEESIGMLTFFAAIGYGCIIFGSLETRWLSSRRMATASAILLVLAASVRLIAFALDPHHDQLSPSPHSWFELWIRLSAVVPTDLAALPIGVWALAVLAQKQTADLFRQAAISASPKPWRPVKSFGCIFAAAAISGIATGLTMDYPKPRPAAPVTAQLSFKVAGPQVQVTLNGQRLAVAGDGRVKTDLPPGDYETVRFNDGQRLTSAYEFYYAGESKHVTDLESDAVSIKGPLTLTFRPGAGLPSVADFTAIQGRWTIVAQVKGGGLLLERQRGEWIEFDADLMRSNVPEAPAYEPFFAESRFALDSYATPRSLDILKTGAMGIYRLDGDTLTLAVADAGQPRPTGFVSASGSLVTLTLCRRGPATPGD